jgi:hypothetical protein
MTVKRAAPDGAAAAHGGGVCVMPINWGEAVAMPVIEVIE